MYKKILLLLLVLLLIFMICRENNNFPFPVYDFRSLTKHEFENIIKKNTPALFTNTIKNNISLNTFCKNLETKTIKTRYGNYGDVNGRSSRKFKNMHIKDLCNAIKKNEEYYGGNNIINKNEMNKINLESSNPNIPLFDKAKLWIGPNGSRTPLHKDEPDNLALQIYGYKKWIFFNSKDNKNLCFKDNNKKLEWSEYEINNYSTCKTAKNAAIYYRTMNPGDLLYLPKQWAHDVTNKSTSIMINYWY
jgi:hypothetical protein